MTTAAQFNTDGEVLGFGLRNIVGMGEDPSGGVVSSCSCSWSCSCLDKLLLRSTLLI
jgi:hypothetical protein